MKNWIKIALIIEVQVILILAFVVYNKTGDLENKLFNTNKFIHEAIIDKETETLNTITANDMVIGTPDACLTIFLYSRYDCSVCNEFFSKNYKLLKKDFIDNGKLKIVARFLTHTSKMNSLFATKSGHYAHSVGLFDAYMDDMTAQFPSLDSGTIRSFFKAQETPFEDYENYINDKSFENEIVKLAYDYRNAKILSTPTFYINNQPFVGNREYSQLKIIISNYLADTDCR